MARRIFPKGKDKLRWSRFKHLKPSEMYEVVSTRVFPFLRELGGDDSTYAQHMKDARFTDRVGGAERAIPHAAPHHSVDG